MLSRVIITGARGFLGSFLAQYLVEAGYKSKEIAM